MSNKSKTKHLLVCIGSALILIFNSFLTLYLIDDGGFVSSFCALVAVIILLVPMINTIIVDFREKKMRMHELAVIAVLASCVQGDFKTSACIALFILVSILIEMKTASGAKASLEALAKLSPGKSRRILPDGSEEEIEGHALTIGDLVRVLPGENILADGTIKKGRSSINESNITGESLPVDKGTDHHVFAGTNNLTGTLEIEVLKAGVDTTIGKVRELIMKAEASRLPFVRVIDEYLKYYTPLVLGIAATLVLFNRQEGQGLDRVVSMLVVACPIALILATPAAVVAALSSAARLGVLFKDVNDIEAMAKMNAFVFDKTGTLTTGELEVVRLAPTDGVESEALLSAASLAEIGSNHPIAKAIAKLVKEANLEVDRPDELHEEPGRGVKVTFGKDKIFAGNLKWMLENGAKSDDFPSFKEGETSGMSLLFILKNKKPLGWIGLSDKPRGDAASSLKDLKAANIGFLAMVSGDRKSVVESVADSLDLKEKRGECSPSEKVSFVEEIKAKGYNVVFIGDGVNDGPALATSHIGIAMGAAGSDVAIESATIALMNNQLNRLPFLLGLARKMKITVLQNFFIGSVLISGGIALSAMGKLSPVLAAILQVAGALVVAMNSAKLIREGEELEDI